MFSVTFGSVLPWNLVKAGGEGGSPDDCQPEVQQVKQSNNFDGCDSMKTQDMSESRMGRVWLHLLCAVRDHHWHWHWQGIRREFV